MNNYDNNESLWQFINAKTMPPKTEVDCFFVIIEDKDGLRHGDYIEYKNGRWIHDHSPSTKVVAYLNSVKLPSDDETENWFEDNIGTKNNCSASSAIFKFRQWLQSIQIKSPY